MLEQHDRSRGLLIMLTINHTILLDPAVVRPPRTGGAPPCTGEAPLPGFFRDCDTQILLNIDEAWFSCHDHKNRIY